jgi:hypothetical protein
MKFISLSVSHSDRSVSTFCAPGPVSTICTRLTVKRRPKFKNEINKLQNSSFLALALK